MHLWRISDAFLAIADAFSENTFWTIPIKEEARGTKPESPFRQGISESHSLPELPEKSCKSEGSTSYRVAAIPKGPKIPKDPAVLKILRDSELLRRSVFTTRPIFTTLRNPLWGEKCLQNAGK